MDLLPLIDTASADGSESVCVNQTNISMLVHKVNPATVVSSVLSLFGSLVIITPFLMWQDLRRSTARKILLLLAVSDFFTAVGYLAASTMYYYFYDSNGHSNGIHWYKYFCSVQAFMTTYFPITSFFWTTYLAIYFVVTLVFHRYHWSWRLLVLFNVTAWGIPFVICLTTVLLHILGSGKAGIASGADDAAGWCFVSSQRLYNASSRDEFNKRRILYFAMEAVCGKMWEILAYFIVGVCYILIFTSKHCLNFGEKKRVQFYRNTSRNATQSSSRIISEALVKVDFKLLIIPLLFIFLRSWGTLRYFISWSPGCHTYIVEGNVCVSTGCFSIFYDPFLLGMQAFCDPLQGFGNAVLFIYLSKPVRHRLLSSLAICTGYHCRLCHIHTGNQPMTQQTDGRENPTPNTTFESRYESDNSEVWEESGRSGDESSSMLEGQRKSQYGSTNQTDGDRAVNQ